MPAYLIDTNVIIDAADSDSEWYAWSAAQLIRAANEGAVFITKPLGAAGDRQAAGPEGTDSREGVRNPIIYAELAGYADSEQQMASILSDLLLERADLPWEAAFLAGRAFVAYRRAGGKRSAPLPDFYIGAHAQVTGLTLLTRDARRYRSYFPDLRLIAPDTTP